MKNTEIAFEYINEAIYNNINIQEALSTDNRLSNEDKIELASILGIIKDVTINSLSYKSLQSNSIKKAQELSEKSLESTNQTMTSLKTSLQDVIKDAKSAYKYVLWMYVVAFYLGVGLIVIAIVFAAQGKTILSIAFGAIGLLDIVSHFVFKPPLDLQSSRANLTQLMIVVTNWFADVMNLNSYLASKGGTLTLEEIESVSTKQNLNTEKMLALIEKYSEPSSKTKPK